MSVQKVKMEKCLLHLTCGKNDDKILLKTMHVTQSFLYLCLCFIDRKLYNFLRLLAIM